jgi:hypothetical protein
MASRTSRKERRPSLSDWIDEHVHAGAFLRNRALLAVARAAVSDRLPEPCHLRACDRSRPCGDDPFCNPIR